MKIERDIHKLFIMNGGVLSRSELNDAGISYYYIRELLNLGQMERIKQGIYRWKDAENDEWVEVQKIIPEGIFCLFSAAFLHQLSTFVPSDYHITILGKDKVSIPEYPSIKLHYWQDPQYSLGKTVLNRKQSQIYLYDREKTVCDFIKFRNKVGIDMMKEVVKSYLLTQNRNLNKLISYSRKLGISSVVESYLELLV